MTSLVQAKIATFLRDYKQPQDNGSKEQKDLDEGLVHAAFSGDVNLVQWFLSKGARIEYWQDPFYDDYNIEEVTFGSSALLLACQRGHLDVVLCLYRSISKSKRQSSREGLRNYWPILIETLKNRNQVHDCNTVLDDAGEEISLDLDPFLKPYVFLENIPLLKYLADSGADLNIPGQAGRTPLMKAASSPRYAEALHVLLRLGANPNITSRQHHSALVCAARAKYMEAMKLLLEYGAYLEHPVKEFPSRETSDSPTKPRMVCHALVLCVVLGHVEEAQLLVRWGARPALIPRYLLFVLKVLDESDLTHYTDCISYLHLAFYTCRSELVRYFLETSFLTPRDLQTLGQDEDLQSRLETEATLEHEEQEERDRNLTGSESARHSVHERAELNENAMLAKSLADFDSVVKCPAGTTLRMFRDFASQPRSLFSLSIMCVRQSHNTDRCRGEDATTRASLLGLPKPLIKSILYLDTCFHASQTIGF